MAWSSRSLADIPRAWAEWAAVEDGAEVPAEAADRAEDVERLLRFSRNSRSAAGRAVIDRAARAAAARLRPAPAGSWHLSLAPETKNGNGPVTPPPIPHPSSPPSHK